VEKLKPRAVIFDLGSTLIEYEVISWEDLSQKCAEASRVFLHKRGFPVPDEGAFHEAFEAAKEPFRAEASRTLVEWTVPQVTRKLFERLAIEEIDGLVDALFKAYYQPVDEHLYVYDDTIPTLRALKKAIPTVGLISNTVFPEAAHLGELQRYGIEPYLDFTIFSSTFGYRKPHPEIFAKAANLAGAAPKECVYIGDRYMEDIEGPAGLGMPAILRQKQDRVYPEEMPLAIRRISTLAELSEHIDF